MALPLLGLSDFLWNFRSALPSTGFAKHINMSLSEAWKTLGLKPGANQLEFKAAFKHKVREVHPDVTGDDGTMLQKVQEAHRMIRSLTDPAMWDASGLEDGLPAWASGLTRGIKWSDECPSYADFLGKPDNKALAVGEMEDTGIRPWAAAWGKFSQHEANLEALRVCRQHGTKCKLVYVGSGHARARQATDLSKGEDENTWWNEQFRSGGETPGFGWMPMINPTKEKLVGYKTVSGGERMGATTRVRVPVFKPVHGGLPYYYSPLRPKERIVMKSANFKHVKPLTKKTAMRDPRVRDMLRKRQGAETWEDNQPW